MVVGRSVCHPKGLYSVSDLWEVLIGLYVCDEGFLYKDDQYLKESGSMWGDMWCVCSLEEKKKSYAYMKIQGELCYGSCTGRILFKFDQMRTIHERRLY